MTMREHLQQMLATAPEGVDERREHYAHSGQLFGWMTTPNAAFLTHWLPTFAKSRVRPPRIVEVGTFAGSTARGLITLTGGGTVDCIDNFTDFNEGTGNGHPDGRSYWEWTLRQHPDLLEFATLHVGESPAIGASWQKLIDLLLVDGDHAFGPALADCRAWCPHVVPGGVVLVDDYHMRDVAKACEAYFAPREWEELKRPIYVNETLLVMRRR